MKSTLKSIFFLFIAIFLYSCSDDETTDQTDTTDPYMIEGNITENKTLTAGNIWTLNGRVSVL